MSHEVRLGVMLNTGHYPELESRYKSGDFILTFAEDNWRKEWYTDPYWNISVPLALSIARCVPQIKSMHLFYLPKIDFHHIMFGLDDDMYCVQWYKIVSCYRRQGQEVHQHYFDSKWDIPGFLQGRHKTSPYWDEKISGIFDPFNPKNYN